MYAESSRRALRLGRFQFVRGFRLTTFTFAGSSSKVDLILEKLQHGLHWLLQCATTHVQNLCTPIRGFHPESQRLIVMATVKAISDHVYPQCLTDTLLEASLDRKNLIFICSQPLTMEWCRVQITILDIIVRCHCDGHQFRPLLTVPNQYKYDFFKSRL